MAFLHNKQKQDIEVDDYADSLSFMTEKAEDMYLLMKDERKQ